MESVSHATTLAQAPLPRAVGEGLAKLGSGLPGLFPAPGPHFPVRAAFEKLIFKALVRTAYILPIIQKAQVPITLSTPPLLVPLPPQLEFAPLPG